MVQQQQKEGDGDNNNDSDSDSASIGHSCFTDEIYAEVEQLYTQQSNHAHLICSFIESSVILGTNNSNKDKKLLDVGAGPGKITRRLAKYFSHVEVIEPNRSYLTTHSEEPAFILNRALTMEDAIICSETFDLVLCLHVLYQVSNTKWAECLTKLHSGLRKPTGRLIVAFTAPRGPWYGLQLSLRPGFGSDLHTGSVCNVLDKAGLEYMRHPVETRVAVPVHMLGKFTNLVRLFAIADCWTATEWNSLSTEDKNRAEAKIKAFIHGTCYSKDRNEYVIDFDEDYVVVAAT